MTTGRINQVAAFPERRCGGKREDTQGPPAREDWQTLCALLLQPAAPNLVLKPRAELECMKGLYRYVCVCSCADPDAAPALEPGGAEKRTLASSPVQKTVSHQPVGGAEELSRGGRLTGLPPPAGGGASPADTRVASTARECGSRCLPGSDLANGCVS